MQPQVPKTHILRSIEPGVDAERPSGLDDLFRRYASYVAAIALRILGRGEEIEDVVQDVFLEAARGLSSLRHPGAIKGWLGTVTVRVAGRTLRARRLRILLGFDRAYDYNQIVDHAATPADGLVLASVYKLLDRQAPADRIPWTLRYLEGVPLERIARMCGCSLATVKRRIGRVDRGLHEVILS